MLLSNTVANLLIRASSIVAQLGIVPIAMTSVGRDNYGLWMTCASVATIATALDLGMVNTAFNVAARSRHGKAAELCVYAAVRKAAWVAFTLLVLLLVAISTMDVDGILHTQATAGETRSILFVVSFMSLAALPFSVFNQLRLGRIQASSIAPFLVITNLASLPAAYLTSQLTTSIHAFVAAATLPALLGQAAAALWSVHQASSFGPLAMTRKLAAADRRVRLEGRQFFMIQLATVGAFHVDNLIIAGMLSTSDVADYSLANRYFSIIAIMLSIYLSTAWPAYAQIARQRDSRRLRQVFLGNLASSIGFAAGVSAVLFAARHWAFGLWTHAKVEPSAFLLLAFATFSIINAVLGNISALMNALGLLKLQARVSLTMLAPNLGLSILLVPRWGAAGTVVASVLCSLVMVLVYLNVLRRQKQI
ncbi:MAG: lipopolysaccharide biosynthesis protein [Burkholderiales bacterium]|jgi:O-antigen/teichoic acid export membrane protein|nr:lipopolysaccharide biosynthesis protein [Burkholderiales bacterium]MBW8892256.1 lipopolysaccharide biosynthesis protein [Burkholderiales bacterium]